MLPVPLLFISKEENIIFKLNTGLLCFYYIFLLRIVKKWYKPINRTLIEKKLINISYSEKDFTYVLWDGDIPTVGHWWNEKLASAPSWLDHLITWLLIIIPILLFAVVNFFGEVLN